MPRVRQLSDSTGGNADGTHRRSRHVDPFRRLHSADTGEDSR
jgi:hypothetical protein